MQRKVRVVVMMAREHAAGAARCLVCLDVIEATIAHEQQDEDQERGLRHQDHAAQQRDEQVYDVLLGDLRVFLGGPGEVRVVVVLLRVL